MTRQWKVIGTIIVLTALCVGATAWARRVAVNEQRAASATQAAASRGQATLTADDACWLALDHYHSGDGRAGRDPLVECLGELVEVPGGYKLTRVLTQSGFMQARMGHDLCLARGATWVVLGDASRLDDCRSLPVGSHDPAADATRRVRALVAADVERARAAVKAALAGPTPPETCASPAPAASTTHLDARRQQPGTPLAPWTGMLPHDPAFELCSDPDTSDPQAALVCTQRRPWTHVIVTRVQQLEPPHRHTETREFSGGHIAGELWLVDVATARAVCRRPFMASMPGLVLADAIETSFSDAVQSALRDAEASLILAPPP